MQKYTRIARAANQGRAGRDPGTMIQIATPCRTSSPQEIATRRIPRRIRVGKKSELTGQSRVDAKAEPMREKCQCHEKPEHRRLRSLPRGPSSKKKQCRCACKAGDTKVESIRADFALCRDSRSGQAAVAVHPREHRLGRIAFLPCGKRTEVKLGDEAGLSKRRKVWKSAEY